MSKSKKAPAGSVQEFADEAEFIRFTQGLLGSLSLSANLAEGLASSLSPAFIELPDGQTPKDSLDRSKYMNATLRWVIRDDDLKLLESFTQGVQAAGGVGFFMYQLPGHTMAGALTGIAVAVFKLIRQVMRKGARLNPLQVKVLLTLKREANGATAAELAQLLSNDQEKWTETEALADLTALTEVAISDGTVEALVQHDHELRWRVAGL